MKHNDGNTTDETRYKETCRLVDISMLSTFMRNYPLTYLREDEREKILEFERYIIELENRTMIDFGVY